MFEYTSKINFANPKSNSLRVGLPKEIVKILKLEAGDSMKWDVDLNKETGELTVVAKKAE